VARPVVRRFWLGLWLSGIGMVVGAAVLASWRDVAGIAIGVVLAAANFKFLHDSLHALLASGNEKPPAGTALLFVARWVVVGLLGYAAALSGLASGGGVIAGLFAPACAASFEAVYQVWSLAHGEQS
jgi:hypothetical protein